VGQEDINNKDMKHFVMEDDDDDSGEESDQVAATFQSEVLEVQNQVVILILFRNNLAL
jgi:hypothetical protein